MIIRAFDGTHFEVQGEIELMIKIGPRSFTVNFQVIKVIRDLRVACRVHSRGTRRVNECSEEFI